MFEVSERDFELPDAETLAYTFSEAVADQEGDEHAQDYLQRFMSELFELEPGLRQHFSSSCDAGAYRGAYAAGERDLCEACD